MNKPVAIVVALVVIAGAGAAAYIGFGNRGPDADSSANTAATSATATATTDASTTAAPAPAASTGDSSTASAPPATTAPSAPAATTTADASDVATAEPAAPQPVIRPEDHVLGSADAPVTIVEYASMTCPHCAAFHADTMPKLKSEFVDKGQVRLVFRPFPLDNLALRASLLAECVPGDGYFDVLNTMFAGQKDWVQAENPLDSLRAIGKTAGIEEGKIDGCMTDEKATERIAAAYKEAIDVYGVNSTPSFIINGKKYNGALPFDDLESGGTKVSGMSTIIRGLLPQ